jgi:cytochrome c oxidase subunit II
VNVLDPHGPEAQRLAGVWWLMFAMAAAVYVVVAGLILVAIVRGRRPSRLSDGGFIWIGGIVVPVVILGVLAAVTVTTTGDVRNPQRGALRIEVVGKRWWWDVDYPDAGVRTANEIHVPVGRQVELGLDSDNVIHSWWVPELAGKVDLIPGQHNVLRFTAGSPGVYRGECAEFCGIQHAHMDFVVVADPPSTFDRWLARRQLPVTTPTDDQEALGQLVFNREACAGCHTIKGTPAHGTVGPDLSDVGSRRWIGAVTVPNTRRYLAAWIADSQALKPGDLMPPIELSASDLRAVVAYLESLR